MWLTSLNMRRFIDRNEPYIITSTDKIEAVAKLHKIASFQQLEYFSIENKISVMREIQPTQKLNIDHLIKLLNEIFICSINEAKTEAPLADKIFSLSLALDWYKAFMKDQSAIEQLKDILIRLNQYNDKRPKLGVGLTPNWSLYNNRSNQRYDVFRYSMSEYGHGIAMIYLLMETCPNIHEFAGFIPDEVKSITAWYVYLKLENTVCKLIYSPSQKIFNDLAGLIDYLK